MSAHQINEELCIRVGQRPDQWGPNQGCLWWGWGQWERSSRGQTRFSQEEIKLIFVSVSKTWRNSKIKKRKFSSTSIKWLLINPLSFHCYVLSLAGANLISIPIYTWLVKCWNTRGYIVWSSQETGAGHHRAQLPFQPVSPTGADLVSAASLTDTHSQLPLINISGCSQSPVLSLQAQWSVM